ncbi:hypothetical protein HDU93_004398 [Gonapodya sp. JEL0774]|nr:hypothetical protein HDU93_004398 [Gonapodya sp. JEL0774]
MPVALLGSSSSGTGHVARDKESAYRTMTGDTESPVVDVWGHEDAPTRVRAAIAHDGFCVLLGAIPIESMRTIPMLADLQSAYNIFNNDVRHVGRRNKSESHADDGLRMQIPFSAVSPPFLKLLETLDHLGFGRTHRFGGTYVLVSKRGANQQLGHMDFVDAHSWYCRPNTDMSKIPLSVVIATQFGCQYDSLTEIVVWPGSQRLVAHWAETMSTSTATHVREWCTDNPTVCTDPDIHSTTFTPRVLKMRPGDAFLFRDIVHAGARLPDTAPLNLRLHAYLESQDKDYEGLWADTTFVWQAPRSNPSQTDPQIPKRLARQFVWK